MPMPCPLSTVARGVRRVERPPMGREGTEVAQEKETPRMVHTPPRASTTPTMLMHCVFILTVQCAAKGLTRGKVEETEKLG